MSHQSFSVGSMVRSVLVMLLDGQRVPYRDGYAMLDESGFVRVYTSNGSYLMGMREFLERVDVGRH